jgi:hypothetical protein
MNNVNFKKRFAAIGAGVALAAGAAVATSANANTLLFPYFATQGGASSYLLLRSNGNILNASAPTVVNAGKPGQRVTSNGNLHYVWNIFQQNGNSLTCQHNDAFGWMTPNDVILQEVSSPIFTDNSVPALLPNLPTGGSPTFTKGVAGFLTVADVTTANVAGTTTTGAGGVAGTTLQGQMAVFDPAMGVYYTYNGIADNNVGGGTTGNEGDFSNIASNSFGLAWYPQGTVQTAYYAVAVGDMSTAIKNQANWAGVAEGLASAPYNNDENQPYSGTVPWTVSCASAMPLQGLMTAANYSQVASTGGQLNLNFTLGTGVDGVVLTKLDVVPSEGKMFFTTENNMNPAVNK